MRDKDAQLIWEAFDDPYAARDAAKSAAIKRDAGQTTPGQPAQTPARRAETEEDDREIETLVNQAAMALRNEVGAYFDKVANDEDPMFTYQNMKGAVLGLIDKHFTLPRQPWDKNTSLQIPPRSSGARHAQKAPALKHSKPGGAPPAWPMAPPTM